MNHYTEIVELGKIVKKFTNIRSELEIIVKKDSDIKSELKLLEKEFNDVQSNLIKLEKTQEVNNKYDLTKSKDVEKFLSVSRESLRRFRGEGRFKENIHYVYTKGGRIKYIPCGIKIFEKEYVKNQKKVIINKEEQEKNRIKENNLNHLNNRFSGRVA